MGILRSGLDVVCGVGLPGLYGALIAQLGGRGRLMLLSLGAHLTGMLLYLFRVVDREAYLKCVGAVVIATMVVLLALVCSYIWDREHIVQRRRAIVRVLQADLIDAAHRLTGRIAAVTGQMLPPARALPPRDPLARAESGLGDISPDEVERELQRLLLELERVDGEILRLLLAIPACAVLVLLANVPRPG